jgi:large subunit ribosomal protein L19
MKARTYTRETILSIDNADRGFPKFSIGDTVAVALRVKEGDKERTQMFEGDVIAMHNHGVASTFTIRRIGANGVAVERVLPFQSPLIESIKKVRSGLVRRAKLYYIRGRVGRAARVKERIERRTNSAQ